MVDTHFEKQKVYLSQNNGDSTKISGCRTWEGVKKEEEGNDDLSGTKGSLGYDLLPVIQ